MRLLRSPNFWTGLGVVIAVVAMALSQLPPISQMMKGTDIRISTPEEISLGHNLGNISVGVFLDIYNAGGYGVNISKIECSILEKDTGKTITFPARTYDNENARSLSLGTITLSPDQHWTNTVYCYSYLPRAEQEQVNDLRSRIYDDVMGKREKLPTNVQMQTWIQLDEKLYQEVTAVFDKKFPLTNEGNYQFFIKAISDSGEILRISGFDFTLFKSNINELRKIKEKDYRYGSGIIARTRYAPEYIYLPITPLSENEAKSIYQQKVENR
jgi:hypothetical protein